MAVRCDVNEDLTVNEVCELLSRPCQTAKVVNAVGGQVFVCKKTPDDWRFDGFRWRQVGKSLIPKKNPKVIKYHYYLTTKEGLHKGFRKFVYASASEASSEAVVIHYVGDASVAKNFPHGNATRSVFFLPTATSLKEHLSNHNVKLVDVCAEKSTEPVQFQPRNSQQKAYFESRAKSKVSKDSFCNLHELAYALPDFVWSITTHPDLVITFGLPDFVNLVRLCNPALVTYDTTFNLGDFYVTTVVLQLTIFVEKPVVPVAFMLHERKFQRLHEELCHYFARKLGQIPKDVIVVTDGEHGCSNALKSQFPHWHVFTCWNHVLRDAEFWLKKHSAHHAEIVVYKSHLHDILSCDTTSSVHMKEATYKALWSTSFVEYYDQFLGDRIRSSFKGILDECGLDGDRITTNNSESMNAVIKRFQDWTEVPPDQLLLSLYKLQLAYGSRINKSNQGFGPYILVNNTTFDSLNLPECVNDNDIDRLLTAATKPESVPDVIVETSKLFKVLHIPDLQVFNVATASGTVHVVHLFPAESCTCPVGTTCCHIIAARKSIGKATSQRKRPPIGTVFVFECNNGRSTYTCHCSLCVRCRKKKDKTSGRKQPRKADVTFTVAPDSSFADCNDTVTSPMHASENSHVKQNTTKQSEETKGVTIDFLPSDKTSTPISNAGKRRRNNVLQDTKAGVIPNLFTPKSTSNKRVRFATKISKGFHPVSVATETAQYDRSTAGKPEVVTLREPKASSKSDEDKTSNSLPSLDPPLVQILLGPHTSPKSAWLNDVIINAAQGLLRANYYDDAGLQDTILVNAGHVHLDDPTKLFVQIFFDESNEHWITVSNRGCRQNTVRVYCSLMYRPSTKCRLRISQYVRSESNQLTFQLMNVAKQRNLQDCGLYAIAYAEQLLSGIDPSPSVYKVDVMRQHLVDCLLNKDLCLRTNYQNNCAKEGRVCNEKGNGFWENVTCDGPVVCSLTHNVTNSDEIFHEDNLDQLQKNCVNHIGDDDYVVLIEKELSTIASLQDLQSQHLRYLVLRNERYVWDMFQGKVQCERHLAYKQGGKDRRFLSWMLPVGAFENEQYEIILAAILNLFGALKDKYFDYAMRVLMPEMMIKITMDIRKLDHEEAEQFLYESWKASN